MKPVGDQWGVAAGAVVDYEIHLDSVFFSLVDDLTGISTISGSSMPGIILSKGKALA
jgi:hypothetical protein